MGADGGSIPTRKELVKTRGKVNHDYDKQNKQDSWKLCALSKEPLHLPVVLCSKGHLYNKEAILNYLLAKDSLSESTFSIVGHIKSLKDIKTLNLTPNPASPKGVGDVKSRDVEDSGAAPFICPITGKEMNGNFRFVYLSGCKCVFSEQAVKEVSSDTCLQCGKIRKENDIVELDPSKVKGEEITVKKRPAAESFDEQQIPAINANEKGYRPSLSGMASFRKTFAIDSLYSKK